MATQNSVNVELTENADGGQVKMGVTARILKWLGADITLTGSGTATHTFPSTSSTLLSNQAAEINALTEKTTLTGNDLFIIEDSAASNAKKKVKQSNILIAGSYTPTGATGTNMDSITPNTFYYMRVGNVVMLAGLVVINQTAVGASVGYLSIPIASNFTAADDCSGNATQPGTGTPNIGSVREDTTNDRMQIDFYTNNTNDTYYRVVAMYVVK